MNRNFKTSIRVRYQETDGQGRVHHSNYLTYFELARVEMLRAGGISYKQLESEGLMLVVSDAKIQYHSPAVYDDMLEIDIETIRARGARILHHYQVTRGDDLIVSGETTIASVRPDGTITRLPEWLRTPREGRDEPR